MGERRPHDIHGSQVDRPDEDPDKQRRREEDDRSREPKPGSSRSRQLVPLLSAFPTARTN